MNASLLVLGAGLASWYAGLRAPAWTRRLGRALRHSWRLVAPPIAALLLLSAADPLIQSSPAGATFLLGRAASLPGIAGRLALLLFLLLPLAADAWLRPAGARTLLSRLGHMLRALVAGWTIPFLVVVSVAHAFTGSWAVSLGGTMAPWARTVAGLLFGAVAPEGAAARADPALPVAVTAMLLAALGAYVLQHAILYWWRVRSLPAWPAEPSRLLRSRWATGLILAGTLLAAFILRWRFLIASNGIAYGLSADGQSYLEEAIDLGRQAELRHVNLLFLFFSGSTWFREPLFIYLLHGWLSIFGPQAAFSMYLTIVASMLWIVMVVAAVWALLGRWPALLAGFLLAIDDMWVRNAVIGLREEVTGLLLATAVVLLFSRWVRSRHLAWLAPLPVALATLTRLDALPLGAFLLLWASVAQRWGWRRAVATVVLGAAILLPAFGGYMRTRGSAMPEATVIATNNWIDEFQDRLGTPGFERDRQVTAFEYLFHYHTPLQVAYYTVRGAGIIYSQFIFSSLSYQLAEFSSSHGGFGRVLGLEWHLLVPLVFAAGCVLLLAQWRRWRTYWLPVACCAVGVLPPIGFSAGVPGHMMYQNRYGYLVAPFATAILAWTICTAVSYARRGAVRVALTRTVQTKGEGRKTNPSPLPRFRPSSFVLHRSHLVFRPSSFVLRLIGRPAIKDAT